MSRAFKCDRCGLQYTRPIFYSRFVLSERTKNDEGELTGFKYIDLCPSCYTTLRYFISVADPQFDAKAKHIMDRLRILESEESVFAEKKKKKKESE